MAAIRVMIVDDHPALRLGVRLAFEQSPDFAVCGDAEDEQQALKLVEQLRPELVILDLSLGGDDGLTLIKRLVRKQADVKIIVYSVQSDLTYGPRALRAGARGYLTKQQSLNELVDAARRVVVGEIVVSKRLNAIILRQHGGASRERPESHPVLDNLTDRELQILGYIGAGYTTGQIAVLLHLSPKTVGAHRENLKNKLAADTGSELVKQAIVLVEEGVV